MVLNRRVVYDTLHKSVVTFLIGFTGVGTAWLTYKGFNWYLCMLIYKYIQTVHNCEIYIVPLQLFGIVHANEAYATFMLCYMAIVKRLS